MSTQVAVLGIVGATLLLFISALLPATLDEDRQVDEPSLEPHSSPIGSRQPVDTKPDFTPAPILLVITSVLWVMNFGALFVSIDPNNHPPEDSALGLEYEPQAKKLAKASSFNRMGRVAANQLESFPMALIVMWAAVHAGVETNTILILASLYTASRMVYVYCYLNSLAPWRTIVFMTGQLCCISSIALGLNAAYHPEDQMKMVPMLVTGLLWILNFGFLFITVNPNNHPPEDSILPGGDFTDDKKAKATQAGFSRPYRVSVNQGESFPMALLVMWAAASSGMHPNWVIVVMGSYLTLRVIYIACYLLKLAPARTIIFVGGQLCCLTALGMGTQAAYGTTTFVPMTCTSVLWLMHFGFLFNAVDPNNHPPEDSVLPGGDFTDEAKKKAAEAAEFSRVYRVSVNQAEQFPMAVLVMWGVLHAGGSSTVMAWNFMAYTILRVAYVFAYLNGMSPVRSILFILAQGACILSPIVALALTP